MEIIQATENEIIINGVVPIDEVPPKKKNGKEDSPDPLIRICHQAKKDLLKENGACVAYNIQRPETHGDKHVTKISFFFSNTGKAKVPSTNIEALCRAETRYCQLMSMRCAERITEYLEELEYNLGLGHA